MEEGGDSTSAMTTVCLYHVQDSVALDLVRLLSGQARMYWVYLLIQTDRESVPEFPSSHLSHNSSPSVHPDICSYALKSCAQTASAKVRKLLLRRFDEYDRESETRLCAKVRKLVESEVMDGCTLTGEGEG